MSHVSVTLLSTISLIFILNGRTVGKLPRSFCVAQAMVSGSCVEIGAGADVKELSVGGPCI